MLERLRMPDARERNSAANRGCVGQDAPPVLPGNSAEFETDPLPGNVPATIVR